MHAKLTDHILCAVFFFFFTLHIFLNCWPLFPAPLYSLSFGERAALDALGIRNKEQNIS